ncbi:MAG: rhomboid family intramembrane serine protease [Flavobacteriales bacterium Tduv]
MKYLIGINILIYVATYAFTKYDVDALLSLYNPMGERFKVYQILTHMFVHSKSFILHIFFNMTALWIFGRQMEYILGTKIFLKVYFLSGLLAAFFQISFNLGIIFNLTHTLDFSQIELLPVQGTFTDTQKTLISAMYAPMMGASGAVSGIVGAFARFFPNHKIFIMPIPFPIAVRKALGIFILGSLISAFFSLTPGVGHFAHIGGTVGGYFLRNYYWKKHLPNS